MILTDITSPVIVILNAGVVYGTVSDTKKYPAGFLDALALAADAEVCHTVCSNQNPLQNAFLQQTGGIADEAVVALAGFQVYDVVHVELDGSPARLAAWTYIDRMRSDPLSRTSIDKMYALRNQVIKHNGTSAVCRVIAFKKGATPQAPDGLLNACISGLLKMASSKMGVGIEAASYFAGESARRLQMIAGGAQSVPEVTQYGQQDKAVA
jgi:hypothetical protein